MNLILGLFMIASGTLSVVAGLFDFAAAGGGHMYPYVPLEITLGYDVFSVIWGICIILLGIGLIKRPIWAWDKAIMILVPYLGFWIAIAVVFPSSTIGLILYPLYSTNSLPAKLLLYVIVPAMNVIVLAYLINGRRSSLGKEEIG
ncbi:MAG: hypothetical protein ACFFBS_04765 [Promethearchaeota archaeon]